MKILIGSSAALQPNTSISISAGDVRIVVFRTAGGELHALEDRCPHRGARLSEGVVYEGYVACRDHGWSICLKDGLVLPPGQGQARSFSVYTEEGSIFVEA
jgi:nitrite reductase (NADH) small subunit